MRSSAGTSDPAEPNTDVSRPTFGAVETNRSETIDGNAPARNEIDPPDRAALEEERIQRRS